MRLVVPKQAGVGKKPTTRIASGNGKSHLKNKSNKRSPAGGRDGSREDKNQKRIDDKRQNSKKKVSRRTDHSSKILQKWEICKEFKPFFRCANNCDRSCWFKFCFHHEKRDALLAAMFPGEKDPYAAWDMQYGIEKSEHLRDLLHEANVARDNRSAVLRKWYSDARAPSPKLETNTEDAEFEELDGEGPRIVHESATPVKEKSVVDAIKEQITYNEVRRQLEMSRPTNLCTVCHRYHGGICNDDHRDYARALPIFPNTEEKIYDDGTYSVIQRTLYQVKVTNCYSSRDYEQSMAQHSSVLTTEFDHDYTTARAIFAGLCLLFTYMAVVNFGPTLYCAGLALLQAVCCAGFYYYSLSWYDPAEAQYVVEDGADLVEFDISVAPERKLDQANPSKHKTDFVSHFSVKVIRETRTIRSGFFSYDMISDRSSTKFQSFVSLKRLYQGISSSWRLNEDAKACEAELVRILDRTNIIVTPPDLVHYDNQNVTQLLKEGLFRSLSPQPQYPSPRWLDPWPGSGNKAYILFLAIVKRILNPSITLWTSFDVSPLFVALVIAVISLCGVGHLFGWTWSLGHMLLLLVKFSLLLLMRSSVGWLVLLLLGWIQKEKVLWCATNLYEYMALIYPIVSISLTNWFFQPSHQIATWIIRSASTIRARFSSDQDLGDTDVKYRISFLWTTAIRLTVVLLALGLFVLFIIKGHFLLVPYQLQPQTSTTQSLPFMEQSVDWEQAANDLELISSENYELSRSQLLALGTTKDSSTHWTDLWTTLHEVVLNAPHTSVALKTCCFASMTNWKSRTLCLLFPRASIWNEIYGNDAETISELYHQVIEDPEFDSLMKFVLTGGLTPCRASNLLQFSSLMDFSRERHIISAMQSTATEHAISWLDQLPGAPSWPMPLTEQLLTLSKIPTTLYHFVSNIPHLISESTLLGLPLDIAPNSCLQIYPQWKYPVNWVLELPLRVLSATSCSVITDFLGHYQSSEICPEHVLIFELLTKICPTSTSSFHYPIPTLQDPICVSSIAISDLSTGTFPWISPWEFANQVIKTHHSPILPRTCSYGSLSYLRAASGGETFSTPSK
jgi:hypothetical protein